MKGRLCVRARVCECVHGRVRLLESLFVYACMCSHAPDSQGEEGRGRESGEKQRRGGDAGQGRLDRGERKQTAPPTHTHPHHTHIVPSGDDGSIFNLLVTNISLSLSPPPLLHTRTSLVTNVSLSLSLCVCVLIAIAPSLPRSLAPSLPRSLAPSLPDLL